MMKQKYNQKLNSAMEWTIQDKVRIENWSMCTFCSAKEWRKDPVFKGEKD